MSAGSLEFLAHVEGALRGSMLSAVVPVGQNVRSPGWFSYSVAYYGDGDEPLVTYHKYGPALWFYVATLTVLVVVATMYVLPAAFVFIRRRWKDCRGKDVVQAVKSLPAAPITAIMPCYLPNEQDIMEDTIMWILEHVQSPGPFTLRVVYNTPKDMPEIQSKIHALAGEHFGRRLFVDRVQGSTSKAENLNAAIPLVRDPYVVIYDADHHPDKTSLLRLYEKMIRKSVDCVQGSTYIRNIEASYLGRFVDAEFFIQHFLIFPAMKFLTRNAFFGGSNALWVRDVIAGKDFNDKLQCEDVDIAIRMLLDGRRIEFCPEARSGELAPGNLATLYKQRLRWALGWDQVSLKHWQGVRESTQSMNCCLWFGLFNMFYLRVVVGFATFFGIIGCPIIAGMCYELSLFNNVGPAIIFLRHCLACCLILHLLLCTFEGISQVRHRGCHSAKQVMYIIAFIAIGGLLYIPYQFTIQVVSMWKICRGNVGEWVVTKRVTTPQVGSILSEPLLGGK